MVLRQGRDQPDKVESGPVNPRPTPQGNHFISSAYLLWRGAYLTHSPNSFCFASAFYREVNSSYYLKIFGHDKNGTLTSCLYSITNMEKANISRTN